MSKPPTITPDTPELKLMKSNVAENHLFIDGAHIPRLCPECIEPGSLTPLQPAEVEKPKFSVEYIYDDEYSPEPAGITVDLPGTTSNQKAFMLEAIKALVEYVQWPIESIEKDGSDISPFPTYHEPTSFIRLANEARQSLQGPHRKG